MTDDIRTNFILNSSVLWSGELYIFRANKILANSIFMQQYYPDYLMPPLFNGMKFFVG
jgi:hypothetical protein